MKARRHLALGMLAGLGVCVPISIGAAQPMPETPPPAVPDSQAIRERLDASDARAARQEEELARLQRELARQSEELARLRARAAEEAKPARAVKVEFSGYVHADWTVWRQSSEDEVNPSNGEPLNQSRVFIRRARLRADAEQRWVLGAVELDGNTLKGPTARILDAEVSGRLPGSDARAPPYVMVTLGLFKIPFGHEVPESERTGFFLERTNAMRALFPGNYDLGLRVSGGWRFLRYAIAAMNGDPIGERRFPGRDPNESRDLLGRAGFDTEVVRGVELRAGFSALTGTGFHEGTPSTKDVLVWRDANENGIVEITEIQVIAGSAATPSENFDRFGLGGDVQMTVRVPRAGQLALTGEVVWAGNLDRGATPADPVAIGRDLRELGWSVSLTQEITRYAMMGVRYDRYDPDADASEQRAVKLVPKDASSSTLAFTGALRYPPLARLIVEYDRNDNHLGRTVGGVPRRLPDDALTLRAEVTF